MPHRIRLRKPWSRTIQRLNPKIHQNAEKILEQAILLDQADRVDVPDTGLPDTGLPDTGLPDTGLVEETSTLKEQSEFSVSNAYLVTYSRRFNRPTGLEAGDRVEFQIEPWPEDSLLLYLNNEKFDGQSLDVTDQLRDHNEVKLQLQCQHEVPRLTSEVNLLITTQ